MSLFGKKKAGTAVPEECRGFEVRLESSTCTGEKTIGFFDPVSKKLMYSELVRSQEDIDSFCEKYGCTLGKAAEKK